MKVIDRKQAAELLKVSVRTVDRYIVKGVLTKKEVGGRIFIRSKDLEALMIKKNLDTKFILENSQNLPDYNLLNSHSTINQANQSHESNQSNQQFNQTERNIEKVIDSEEGDFTEMEVYDQKPSKEDDSIYQKLYEEAQEDLQKKQERLEAANYRVGQLEGMLKESIPLLDFKKAIASEKEKRENLEKLLSQIEDSTETLTQTLETKERELEHVSGRLHEEKITKKTITIILIILFLLQPLWVLFPQL